MARAETNKLFVNLSASQTRKRLRGFGHGVKKICSVGKNQAVILHTATGQHLRELESVLADASPVRAMDELDIPVQNLQNLGPTSAAWLRDVGIYTRADLERIGVAAAYRLVRQRRPQVSVNLLWAMEGALRDCDWRELGEALEQRLRREVDEG